MIKVSLITIQGNNLEYFEPYLKSLYKHTNYDNYELLVIDNGSTSTCIEQLNSLLSKYKSLGVTLSLHTNDKMKSFAENCNAGAEKANGELLCFISDDTEPKENWLTEMVATLNRHDKCGVVGAKMYFPDGMIQHCGIAFHKNKMPGNIWFRQKHKDDPLFNIEREMPAVTGGCMLIRKKLFEQVGGFDEMYKYGGYEDIDLCLKVNETDYKIFYCPKAEVLHHEKITQNKLDPKIRKEYYTNNTNYFLDTWYDKIVSNYHKYEPGVE